MGTIIKRATIGGFVKADMDGTGRNIVVGKITKFDKSRIYFAPADGGEECWIIRSEAMKATNKEFADAYDMAKKTTGTPSSGSKKPAPDDKDEDEDETSHGSGLIHANLEHYVVGGNQGIKAPSGRLTLDIDDDVAQTLRGLDLKEVYETTVRVLKSAGYERIELKNGSINVNVRALKARYGHLNPGMQRMTLGNLLRSA